MNVNYFSQRFALPTLRLSAILIGFTVPISTALDNLLLALVLLGLLFNARAVLKIATHHPIARATWLLFGMLLCATFYGVAPWREAMGVLGKYMDLAFVPLFMVMLPNETARHRAQQAFLAAMGLTLILSYLVGLHLLPPQHWMTEMATPDNPVIFHSHITQNNMMAFAAFLALLKLRDATSHGLKAAWGIFSLLAMSNVLFMIQGRTGYLILLVLLAWLGWTTFARFQLQRHKPWGWQQGFPLFLFFCAAVVAAFYASPRLHDRASLAITEFQAWKPNQEDMSSSIGTRLNFYYNATQIVIKHPFIGVGTGGFEGAFTEQIKGTNLTTTPNPHNEFLLISAQLGLFGLVLLIYLFLIMWRHAPSLDSPFKRDAAYGLVLAYIVNCTFNSALRDHADGLFFSFMAAVLFASLKTTKRD